MTSCGEGRDVICKQGALTRAAGRGRWGRPGAGALPVAAAGAEHPQGHRRPSDGASRSWGRPPRSPSRARRQRAVGSGRHAEGIQAGGVKQRPREPAAASCQPRVVPWLQLPRELISPPAQSRREHPYRVPDGSEVQTGGSQSPLTEMDICEAFCLSPCGNNEKFHLVSYCNVQSEEKILREALSPEA